MGMAFVKCPDRKGQRGWEGVETEASFDCERETHTRVHTMNIDSSHEVYTHEHMRTRSRGSGKGRGHGMGRKASEKSM